MNKNNDTTEPETEAPESNRVKLEYLGVGLIVFVVVVAVGIGALGLFRNKSDNQPDKNVNTFHATPTTPTEKSYAYQLTGQYDQAYKVLDEAIAQAGNNTEKAALYNEKSIAALNAKDYAFALEMAKESEKLGPTVSSAHIIAESSERLGDKKTAVDYLKKQIDRTIKSDKPYIQEDIDALRQMITQLESAP